MAAPGPKPVELQADVDRHGGPFRPRRWPADLLRGWLWLAGPFCVYALLRVPSVLEPHWYTDEAGYVTTAQALLQGKLLYAQIWTNKPPIQIWTVAAVIETLGASEAALHAVTFLSGIVTLLAVAYAGIRLIGRPRTCVALVIGAVLLGTPILNAELLLPESLLIAPITWAGALLLTRVGAPDPRRWPLWPAGVGALVALAVCYQQTALAETCAFGLVLALAPAPGGSRRRRVAVYASTVTVLTALWLVPSVALAGAGSVAYSLVGFWVPFTQSKYPTGPGELAGALAVPATVLGLLLSSAWLLRRRPPIAWAPWVWVGASLLVPAVARQPYAHYLVPSVAPVALAVSSLGLRSGAASGTGRRRSVPRFRGLAAAGLVAAAAVAGWAAAVAVPPDWLGTTVAYYGGALATLARQQPLLTWQDSFDDRVAEDREVAAWIRTHNLEGSSAVVWSGDAWLYWLDHLQLVMPTPPIYNDAVLLGSAGTLAQQVAELQPELVVTEESSQAAMPQIDSVLEAGYTRLDSSGGETVWVRDNLVAAVGGASPSD